MFLGAAYAGFTGHHGVLHAHVRRTPATGRHHSDCLNKHQHFLPERIARSFLADEFDERLWVRHGDLFVDDLRHCNFSYKGGLLTLVETTSRKAFAICDH